MGTEILIKATNVHKSYGVGEIMVHALRGVDLTINKGEMVAIMGPSGCGKTTLLNCLSGLDDVTEGRIEIQGKDLMDMSENEKTEYRARHMGFIFQFYNLLPVLTALENVELPLLISRVKPVTAMKRAKDALKLVGLKGWETHRPAELSGGQRQRVTIARSLVTNPLIVFLDEHTGDLDRETTDDILNIICQLNKEKKQTFVLVTHDPNVADRTHRILKMESGIIEREYKPAPW